MVIFVYESDCIGCTVVFYLIQRTALLLFFYQTWFATKNHYITVHSHFLSHHIQYSLQTNYKKYTVKIIAVNR